MPADLLNAPPPSPAPPRPPADKSVWLMLALFVSVLGVVGSLYQSVNLELKACSLCYYQRAFMMAAATILLFGNWLRGVPTAALTPLALASAVAGTGIAWFHVYLDAKGILECPIGATTILVTPQESFIVYVMLTAFLLCDLFQQSRYVPQGMGAVLIGIVFAIACVNPKVTPTGLAPTQPYGPGDKLDSCRRLYVPKN